jgi:uncharacterized protein YlzI (FlbEa/FlbD family)
MICLTKNGGYVLVNEELITQVECIRTEKNIVLSKVYLSNGQYVLVEENLKDLFHILNGSEAQVIDWNKTSIPNFFENERKTFNRPQRRNYNSVYNNTDSGDRW